MWKHESLDAEREGVHVAVDWTRPGRRGLRHGERELECLRRLSGRGEAVDLDDRAVDQAAGVDRTIGRPTSPANPDSRRSLDPLGPLLYSAVADHPQPTL